MAKNNVIPNTNKYRDYTDFMIKHTVQKNNGDKTAIITNTRIGGDSNSGIYGGSYSINDDDYDTFLKLYYNNVYTNNKKEYLTEKQRDTDGPILIDLDFRHTFETTTRQYTPDHIDDLIDAYLDELKNIYQFDSSTEFPIFVLEKQDVNRVEAKQYTKDGIHIIIGLQSDHIVQQLLRNKIIHRASELMSDFPMINTWDDVFDDGISKGTTNWQLFGSQKPNHERYELSYVYNIKFDTNDNEFITKTIDLNTFDIESNLHKLSVRYKNHPSLFMKNCFISTYEDFIKTQKGGVGTGNNNLNKSISLSNLKQHTNDMLDDLSVISNIRNADDLALVLNNFLDGVSETLDDYELKTAYDYTMILPKSYYDNGSYNKWIRVGWVLRNTSKRLLIVWIAFSAQHSNFQYSSIPDLCEMWRNFDLRLHGGLTKLSLIHWAKTDAYTEYDKVRQSTIDYYIERTISSREDKYRVPDFDLASVLFQIFKHEYVCVSVSKNIWYRYNNHRWAEIDSGTTLRKSISVNMRDLYYKKSMSIHTGFLTNTDDNQNTQQDDINKKRTINILNICQRLANTNDKKNIMTEAKELFYDGTFLQKLDLNPYLLCFTNGVIDFKAKTFRKGQPDDNISMCTNNEYVPLTNDHTSMINEINDFMVKLFPEKELCKYMWEHLSSTLLGTSANQTFNMYIGIGQNGKSVLVNLMEKVLGDYKGDVPLTLVTEKRGKVGGLTPEIVQLKGIRYAVMQEPSKGDVINEGMMKQLTSGKDPIQGRAPYMLQTISFIPQFKLVVTCNTLMTIKSNDHGTWRRIRAVPFKSLFTDNPIEGDADKPYQYKLDKHIDEKFDNWKVIFASMLVEMAFQNNGVVTDCDVVMSKSKEYRQSQDYLSEFVQDRIIKISDGRIKKMELNSEFNIWYMSNNGGKCPSPKELHDFMDAEFGRSRNQVWSGVSINYDKSNNNNNNIDISEIDDDINNNDL
jgi:P4 family phage/plasmid primase-like protien